PTSTASMNRDLWWGRNSTRISPTRFAHSVSTTPPDFWSPARWAPTAGYGKRNSSKAFLPQQASFTGPWLATSAVAVLAVYSSRECSRWPEQRATRASGPSFVSVRTRTSIARSDLRNSVEPRFAGLTGDTLCIWAVCWLESGERQRAVGLAL